MISCVCGAQRRREGVPDSWDAPPNGELNGVGEQVLADGVRRLRPEGSAGPSIEPAYPMDGPSAPGVCAGEGDYSGAPVWLFRAAFIAMAVTGLPGVGLYVLMSMALSFPPADRQHMFAFRARRVLRLGRAGG
jgi:phage shock protein PspC (stress-responsive transcriptional regulator)